MAKANSRKDFDYPLSFLKAVIAFCSG